MRFRLKVIDGQPRATFPGEEPRRAELLSRLLTPNPYHVTILLWEILRVRKGYSGAWAINVSNLRVACDPGALVIEEGAPEAFAPEQPARAELTLVEADELLTRWRDIYVRWEFRRAYRKGKEEAKVRDKFSRDRGVSERPILFRVSDRSGRHLGLARDLAGAVSVAGTRLRRGEKQNAFSISAVYADGSEEELPPARYCRRKEATVEDAIRYIRRRDEGIRMAKGLGVSDSQIEMLLGDQVERCAPDDPEDKQIEDYIRNAPEEWLPDNELRAEEAKIFRVVNSRKEKRKAAFIFST